MNGYIYVQRAVSGISEYFVFSLKEKQLTNSSEAAVDGECVACSGAEAGGGRRRGGLPGISDILSRPV